METAPTQLAGIDSAIACVVAEHLLTNAANPVLLVDPRTRTCVAASKKAIEAGLVGDPVRGDSRIEERFSPLEETSSDGPDFWDWLSGGVDGGRLWLRGAGDDRQLTRLEKRRLGGADSSLVAVTVEESDGSAFIDEFHRINAATRSYSGEAYFLELARSIGAALGCEYTCVATVQGGKKDAVKTIAIVSNDGPMENFEYKLQGTPCANVISGSACYHPVGVQAIFPDDDDLVAMGVQCYFGVPMQSCTGEIIGHLAVMHTEPMIPTRSLRWILEIFAVRAAAELEKTRAEKKLEESRERFEAIFRLAPDALFLIDAEGEHTGRIVDANLMAARLHGYEVDELVGMQITDLDLPSDSRLAAARFSQLQQGKRLVFEVQHYRKDGSVMPMEVTAERIDLGGHTYVLSFNKDITVRKATVEQLRTSEERLSLAVDAGGVGIWDWNVTTGETHYSPEWVRQLGYAEGEIEPSLSEFETRVHPEDMPRVQEALRCYFEERSSSYDIECRLRHKDGTYRWIHTRGDTRRDASGNVVRMLGCHIDVTDRRLPKRISARARTAGGPCSRTRRWRRL